MRGLKHRTVRTLQAAYVRLSSAPGGQTWHSTRLDRVLPPCHPLHQSTPEDRTGWKRQKGFLEGTEVSKDEIISMSRHIPKEEIGPMSRAHPLDLGAVGPCLHRPPALVWKLLKRYPDYSQKGCRGSGQFPKASHEADSQLTWLLATVCLAPHVATFCGSHSLSPHQGLSKGTGLPLPGPTC